VEGLKAFGDPSKLLFEIFRTLKPGGRLIFSDLIYDLAVPIQNRSPKVKNLADSPGALQKVLEASGFQQVTVYDMTELCWKRFQHHLNKHLGVMVLANEISQAQQEKALLHLPNHNLAVSYYTICSATKSYGGQRKGLEEVPDGQHNL
jgi:hypothetical protein